MAVTMAADDDVEIMQKIRFSNSAWPNIHWQCWLFAQVPPDVGDNKNDL